jgi:hypothetical protein
MPLRTRREEEEEQEEQDRRDIAPEIMWMLPPKLPNLPLHVALTISGDGAGPSTPIAQASPELRGYIREASAASAARTITRSAARQGDSPPESGAPSMIRKSPRTAIAAASLASDPLWGKRERSPPRARAARPKGAQAGADENRCEPIPPRRAPTPSTLSRARNLLIVSLPPPRGQRAFKVRGAAPAPRAAEQGHGALPCPACPHLLRRKASMLQRLHPLSVSRRPSCSPAPSGARRAW